MIVIGVTGSPGSGKSTVCKRLKELGACVISADDIAQELLDDPEIANRLVDAFGAGVIVDDRVDRNTLGQIVFSDRDALEELNGIMHPPLLAEIQKRLDDSDEEGCAVAVIDAALILEWGIEDKTDLMIYVDAPESTGIERLMKRPGMTLEKARGIFGAQLPGDRKCEQCDLTIDAGGRLENTMKEVDSIWNRLDEEVRNAGRRKIDDK